MSRDAWQIVGADGQVIIPKQFRDQFGIQSGDHVVIHEAEGKLVIEPPVTKEDLAEGYRRRAERDRVLMEELAGVSTEANEHLDDGQQW